MGGIQFSILLWSISIIIEDDGCMQFTPPIALFYETNDPPTKFQQ